MLFRVWAPKAQKVQVELGGKAHDMQPAPGGWHVADLAGAAYGCDYRFRLDGADGLPDPRSPWQPQGVLGPSRTYDHAAFEWHDSGFQSRPLGSAVVYELHVGTFTPEGTFDSMIGRLDYLKALGITHIELMPVNEFTGRRGWGYDGADLFAPYSVYGGPDGLKRLVDACHIRGLAVIQDVVYNHLGPEGSFLDRFGYYFTDRYGTPWGKSVNLDGEQSDESRRFFIDNALMFLRDYHVDGLRLDGCHAIIDTSAVHFLEQMADDVKRLEAQVGRHLFLVAESALNDPRLMWPVVIGGYGLDAQWNDDFHHALHVVLTGETNGYYADYAGLGDLAKTLREAFVIDGRYSPTRQRNHGRPIGALGGHSFVVCMQNHDQIGNRATGDRIHHTISLARTKIGAALLMTSPYVPMIFQGEEWAASTPFQYFADYQDRALREALGEGRRKEFAGFGWDPAAVPDALAPEAVDGSKLRWDEKDTGDHGMMLDWYRRLIALRHSRPDLTDGQLNRTRVLFDEEANWLVMRRNHIAVLCNFAHRPQRLSPEGGQNVPQAPHEREHLDILLASDDRCRFEDSRAHLPPESVMIVGPHKI